MLAPVVALGLALVVVERVFPARALPAVRGFLPRAAALNLVQLVVVIVAGYTWDTLLRGASVLELGEELSTAAGALVGYLVATFVYYWWHRARHEARTLWLACHQLHHSPSRIEVVTSFYKHPVEVLCNSLLSSALSYALLGLTLEQAALVTALSGAAEFFYHLNVRTPRWLGFFVQRPEMHRVHHERGRHTSNFADLPLWDMLFGTYRNPEDFAGECGFSPERELDVGAMLRFEDVHAPRRERRARGRSGALPLALVLVGLAQPLGFLVNSEAVRGVGLLSAASPLPFVFSAFRGVETFAADFALELVTEAGERHELDVTPALYAQLAGPYNRRNAYGAVMSYGPALRAPHEREMVQSVLRYGLCDGGPLASLLGEGVALREATIVVRSRTAGDDAVTRMAVGCAP